MGQGCSSVASGTELGHFSVTVPANYTGEVVFPIIGISGPLPANTAIIYAVFNKAALALGSPPGGVSGL